MFTVMKRDIAKAILGIEWMFVLPEISHVALSKQRARARGGRTPARDRGDGQQHSLR